MTKPFIGAAAKPPCRVRVRSHRLADRGVTAAYCDRGRPPQARPAKWRTCRAAPAGDNCLGCLAHAGTRDRNRRPNRKAAEQILAHVEGQPLLAGRGIASTGWPAFDFIYFGAWFADAIDEGLDCRMTAFYTDCASARHVSWPKPVVVRARSQPPPATRRPGWPKNTLRLQARNAGERGHPQARAQRKVSRENRPRTGLPNRLRNSLPDRTHSRTRYLKHLAVPTGRARSQQKQ